VWAISSPRATTERLFSLVNGGFELAEPGRGSYRLVHLLLLSTIDGGGFIASNG